jgi:death-on-curing protein
MNWITLAELALIHERVIEETGGVHGITNPGGLESSLERPFTKFGGIELFPDLISKIAALIHSLIAFHPFVDGSKRTALVAADVCLRLNGYRLIPSADVESFFWSVARGEKEIDEITEWLKDNIEHWPQKQTY